jgi:RNA polymerase primary sigma factor
VLSNHQERSEALDQLLAWISRQPELPTHVELELASRARQRDAKALDRLVTANLGRLVHVARTFRGKGLPLEDLVQEGTVGLLEAAGRFDPHRGVRFFTYAAFFVRRALVAAVSRGSKQVRVPRHRASQARRLREAADAYRVRTGRPPSDAELARSAGVSEASVASGRSFVAPYEVSADAPASDRNRPSRSLCPLPDPAPRPDAELEARELHDDVRAALVALPPRERAVLLLRHGFLDDQPRTLRELGERLQVSKERVRQIEERAQEGVRAHLLGRRARLQPVHAEASSGA